MSDVKFEKMLKQFMKESNKKQKQINRYHKTRQDKKKDKERKRRNRGL